MAYERRYSLLAAVTIACTAAAAAWDYGAERVSDFFAALMSVVDWRPTASEALDIDRVSRELASTDVKERPFRSFMERARNHLRFLGDGFVDPGLCAAV